LISYQWFKERIDKFLLDQLKNLNISTLFDFIKYFSQNEKVNQKLHDDLKAFTINAIEYNIESMTRNDMNKLVDLQISHNFNDLVKNVLNKKWPKDENDESIFKFIFECNPFLKVVVFMEKNFNKNIHEEKETQIISLLDSTLERLSKGTIKLSLLNLLNSNRKILKEMLTLFSERLYFKFWTKPAELEAMVDKVFEFRLTEVESVTNFTSQMVKFDYIMKTTHFYEKGIYLFI